MPLLVSFQPGLFVLLQLGRCHIILNRIIIFVPCSYLVLGSLCIVCPVMLSSVFLRRLCVLLTLFKLLDASIVSRLVGMIFSAFLFLCLFCYAHSTLLDHFSHALI